MSCVDVCVGIVAACDTGEYRLAGIQCVLFNRTRATQIDQFAYPAFGSLWEYFQVDNKNVQPIKINFEVDGDFGS